MKETIKSSRTLGYLEKIYRQLNIDFFNGELEDCTITVQSTPRAYGHVTCSKVWKVKDSNRYELNIGAGTLNRPIESVVSTMLHEMVHIYNLMHDIQDCSRENTYHNKKFKEKAESVGLIIDYDKRIGWSVTSPSDALILYICDKGWNDIMMNRGESAYTGIGGGNPTAGTATPPALKIRKPSSTRKYICPNCGMSVRATRDVRIMCVDCMEIMEKVED